MIGDGGKIGGKPPAPHVDAPVRPVPKALPNDPTTVDNPADRFERGAKGAADSAAPQRLAREASASTDVLRLARENPAAARQLVATMASQSATALSQIAQEMASARAMLEQLASEKFTKKAQAKHARELRKKRDKLALMKMRLHLGARKMALLQQLAGKLGDPRLEEELDRLLKHHDKLKTDWGKRHHLLSIADTLYGAGGDTPAHLREVVRADVRSGAHGEGVANALTDVSPRRVIAELIARTLDGTLAERSEVKEGVQRGEHGKTLQSWTAVKDIMVASLEKDPFGEDEK